MTRISIYRGVHETWFLCCFLGNWFHTLVDIFNNKCSHKEEFYKEKNTYHYCSDLGYQKSFVGELPDTLSAPRHCLNQCWFIVSWVFGEITIKIQKFYSKKIHLQLLSALANPGGFPQILWEENSKGSAKQITICVKCGLPLVRRWNPCWERRASVAWGPVFVTPAGGARSVHTKAPGSGRPGPEALLGEVHDLRRTWRRDSVLPCRTRMPRCVSLVVLVCPCGRVAEGCLDELRSAESASLAETPALNYAVPVKNHAAVLT